MHEIETPRAAILIEPTLRVRLDYQKFDAERPQRLTIDATATWWAGDFGFVRGLDLASNADRTFRTDRIEGWEIVDAPRWLAPSKSLYSDLKQVCEIDRARASRVRSGNFHARPQTFDDAIDYVARTIDELAAMRLVAAYIGGVDGRVTKNEQKALEAVLNIWSRGLGIERERLVGERVAADAFDEALVALRSAPEGTRRAALAAAYAIAMATAGLKPEARGSCAHSWKIESAFGLSPA